MTTPTDADRAAAKAIAIRFSVFPDGRLAYGPTWGEEMEDAIAQAIADARAMKAGHVRLTIENMPNGKTGIECIPNLSDFDQSPAATLARKMLKAVGIKRPGDNGDWLLTKDKRRLKLTTDDEAAERGTK